MEQNEIDEFIEYYYNIYDEEKLMKESIAVGKIRAKERGFKQGFDEGFNEVIEQSKKKMARNMLKENMDISLISKYTGLSKKQIKNIVL